MLSSIKKYIKSAIFDPVSDLVASVINNANGNVNELAISYKSHVCPDNSTSTPLGIGVVFTGDWQDTLDYNNVIIGIKADADSATDGLQILWSSDAVTVEDSDVFSILANAGKVFTFGAARRYVKLIYTNGGVGQTVFSLETRLVRTYFKPSSHRINDPIVGEDDAELMKSVLTGLAPDGLFKNVLVTNEGEQKISIEAFDAAVSTTLTDFTDNMDGVGALNTASAMFARVNDTLIAPIKADASTQDLQVVTHVHAEIHGADTYRCFSNKDVPNGGTYNIAFTTPDTLKYIHFTFTVDHEQEADFKFYEDVTSWTGGSALTPANADRNSVNTSGIVDMVFDVTVTLGTPVTLIHEVGGSGKKFGGSADHDREWILKQNTTYYMLITDQAVSGNNETNFQLDWYEHTAKN